MLRLIFALLCLTLLCWAPAASAADGGVAILCYHDIGNTGNVWSVNKDTFIEHLKYIQENGYTPISLEQYIAAVKNQANLPEKPILLTFDDGYLSFYTEVFPLLKQYRYPAVFAVVTSWLEYPPEWVKGSQVTWEQIKEMDSSGLVAISSHTHDLHKMAVVGPSGQEGHASSSLLYINGKRETMKDYAVRILSDLKTSQELFEKKLGHRVKSLAWPYGEHTPLADKLALAEGFDVLFVLEGGYNFPERDRRPQARRIIMYNNPTVHELDSCLKNPQ